jgi:hypothetical protein
MNEIDIITQAIGLLGAVFLMLSFQMKSEGRFFAFQTTGSGFFLINYLLLGAWSGVLISIMSVTRSALTPFLKGKIRYILFPLLLIVPIVAGFFIYTGIETILMITAYCIFTLAMFTKNSRLIRITQLIVASPLQLAHNIIVFSLGGILCETFNILSIIVSIFRFGLKDFDNKENKKHEK